MYNRLAFGPRPGDLDAPPDFAGYLERQLEPERIADDAVEAALEKLDTLRLSPMEFLRQYRDRRSQRIGLEQLFEARLLRAISSRRQLQEVLVDFWFNHFNVFAGKGACRVLVSAYERDAIRPHILGRFRDLLLATARHPAMLFYLDNWLSVAENTRAPGRRRGLNENYARELLELHTLGVDGGYSQEDILAVARAFTGWTIVGPRRPQFVFVGWMHDTGPKPVLGQSIRAGGIQDGEAAIDLLSRHPSTARFIATKLVRRFVSDAPPPALVARAAETFRQTDGNIRETLRVILRSPEFHDSEGQKVKTPFEFLVSALRATGARVENPAALGRLLRSMGQPLYGAAPPTGYPDTAADWMSAGTLLARLNVVTRLASGRIRGVILPRRDPEGVLRQLGTAGFQRR